MRFLCDGAELDVPVRRVIVAGWTGRDTEAVQHHIAELAALGVPPPSAVPLFYRVSRSLLTRDAEIEVLGPDTSGEVEPVILHHDGALWLGLGSDHTDRALEATSVAAAKQACPKPVGPELWPLGQVEDRLDGLELRCWIDEGTGDWTLYQEGTLARIRPLGDLVQKAGLEPGDLMFCGTLPAIGPIRPAGRCRMDLSDPIRQRRLTLTYRVDPLPVVA